MNQKNSLGLNKSFKDEDNPILLFENWFEEAKKSELNDPNALSLATSDNKGIPSVRMVLLKSFDDRGFVFYTNLNSVKSKAIKDNPIVSMCFHWKSLLRQIRIIGKASNVSDQEADEYYNSRSYGSRIGAWASNQSSILNSREELNNEIAVYKSRFPNNDKVPRPSHWSGWRVNPSEIEFWLDGDSRIHERLKYNKVNNGWKKVLLNP